MKVPVPAGLSMCLQDFNGDVARGWLADKVANRRAGQALEMAHRQSGGYKEEPGVAVAGDHVSSLFFSYEHCHFYLFIAWFFRERWIGLSFSRLYSFWLHGHDYIASPQGFSHFASYSASVQVYQGSVQGGARRCGFDTYISIRSRDSLASIRL